MRRSHGLLSWSMDKSGTSWVLIWIRCYGNLGVWSTAWSTWGNIGCTSLHEGCNTWVWVCTSNAEGQCRPLKTGWIKLSNLRSRYLPQERLLCRAVVHGTQYRSYIHSLFGFQERRCVLRSHIQSDLLWHLFPHLLLHLLLLAYVLAEILIELSLLLLAFLIHYHLFSSWRQGYHTLLPGVVRGRLSAH